MMCDLVEEVDESEKRGTEQFQQHVYNKHIQRRMIHCEMILAT